MNSHNMLTVIVPGGAAKQYINGRRVSRTRWDLCEFHAEKDCYHTQIKKDGRIFQRHCARGPMNFAAAPRDPLQEFSWEYTDTFSGEANYSWLRRGKVKARSMLGAGISGMDCRRDDFGDSVALFPRGACVVLFVS
jgi:hypothetical protein